MHSLEVVSELFQNHMPAIVQNLEDVVNLVLNCQEKQIVLRVRQVLVHM